MSQTAMSLTGRFTALYQNDTTARAYADPAAVTTEQPAQAAIEDSECVGEKEHPAFKLVAFWHRMGVLGVDQVAHHA